MPLIASMEDEEAPRICKKQLIISCFGNVTFRVERIYHNFCVPSHKKKTIMLFMKKVNIYAFLAISLTSSGLKLMLR